MATSPTKPKKPEAERWEDLAEEVLKGIKDLKNPKSLRHYSIRKLVKHTQALGEYLAENDVKTNQLRKFLDAVNRIKADLRQESSVRLDKIEVELQVLKPKLAYAVGRSNKQREKPALDAFSQVINAAIDSIKDAELIRTESDKEEFREDFERLVYLIESVVAYHKAAGGKNQ
jgi:CRISPR-associated protein Csm2